MSAISKSQVKFPEVRFTSNTAADVIKLIKNKNILALYTEKAYRIFHNLSDVDLSKRRVVYVNCSSIDYLGLEEWSCLINKKIPSAKEVQDDTLKSKIIEKLDVPHKVYVGLGY